MNDLEAALFETISEHPATPNLAATALIEASQQFKSIVEALVPQSHPRLLCLAWTTEAAESMPSEEPRRPGLQLLNGFDELINSGVIAQEIFESANYFGRRANQVPIQDPEVARWMQSQGLACLFAMPIRARFLGQTETICYLTLTLDRDCAAPVAAAICSLLRRFGLLFQQQIHLAQITVPIDEFDAG